VITDRRAGLVLAVLTLIAAASGAVAVASHPHAFVGASALLVVGTSVLLAAYLVYAVHLARRAEQDGRGLGLWFGIAAATCWSAEIWAGGPARLNHVAERLTGGLFALLAVQLTLAAGIVAGAYARRPAGVWRSGLLAGATSGAVVYAFAIIMTMSTLPILGARSDYRTQFSGSHLPNMADFLVNDILGAVTAHLMINVALGALGSVVGRIVLAFRTRLDAAPAGRTTTGE
jgi:hypothetical protein